MKKSDWSYLSRFLGKIIKTELTVKTIKNPWLKTGDPELVIEILVNRMSYRRQMEALGRTAILKHFFTMDNIYLEMKWEITSVIPLVGRFCPSDTMRLWKSGNHIRVDFRYFSNFIGCMIWWKIGFSWKFDLKLQLNSE